MIFGVCVHLTRVLLTYLDTLYFIAHVSTSQVHAIVTKTGLAEHHVRGASIDTCSAVADLLQGPSTVTNDFLE
jgi:hypothetical protein